MQGHPAQGYPAQGYPAQGYPAQGYPAQGYPAQGYPAGGQAQASSGGGGMSKGLIYGIVGGAGGLLLLVVVGVLVFAFSGAGNSPVAVVPADDAAAAPAVAGSGAHSSPNPGVADAPADGAVTAPAAPQPKPEAKPEEKKKDVAKPATPAKPKGVMQQLTGVWVAFAKDGQQLPPDLRGSIWMRISPTQVVAKDIPDRPAHVFKLTVNHTVTPHQFNLDSDDPNVTGSHGIFKVDGDNLTLGLNPQDKRKRPASFDTPGVTVLTLVRETDPAKAASMTLEATMPLQPGTVRGKGAVALRKQLQGGWVLVAVRGQPVPDKEGGWLRVREEDAIMKLSGPALQCRLAIDTTTQPPVIRIDAEQQTILGGFSITGDKLKVTFGARPGQPPADGNGMVFDYQRVTSPAALARMKYDQQAVDNLEAKRQGKKIADAILEYHNSYRLFPADFRPSGSKHAYSWRVLILGEMYEGDAAEGVDFEQAWNSPQNKAALVASKNPFRTGYSKSKELTTWRLITDHANTGLLLVLGTADGEQIPWLKADPAKIDPSNLKASLGTEPADGYLVVRSNGKVTTMKGAQLSAALRKAKKAYKVGDAN